MLLYWSCVLALMAIFRCSAADSPLIHGTATLDWDWAEGFKVNIRVEMQYPVSNGWRIALIFYQPIEKIEVCGGAEVLKTKTSADQKTYALKEKDFNKNLMKGDNLTFAVIAHKSKKNGLHVKVKVLFKGGTVIPRLVSKIALPGF